jgi:hypothetical protein
VGKIEGGEREAWWEGVVWRGVLTECDEGKAHRAVAIGGAEGRALGLIGLGVKVGGGGALKGREGVGRRGV